MRFRRLIRRIEKPPNDGVIGLLDIANRALKDDLSFVQKGDAIGEPIYTLDIVTNDNARHIVSLPQIPNDIVDEDDHERIEPRRRLVEKHELRLVNRRSRKRNALFHSTR